MPTPWGVVTVPNPQGGWMLAPTLYDDLSSTEQAMFDDFGLGLASAPAIGPGVTSRTSTPLGSPQMPVAQPPDPQTLWDENPLAAIGHVLSSLSAGLQGRPLPQLEDREKQRQQKYQNMFSAAEQVRQALKETESPEARSHLVQSFKETFGSSREGAQFATFLEMVGDDTEEDVGADAFDKFSTAYDTIRSSPIGDRLPQNLGPDVMLQIMGQNEATAPSAGEAAYIREHWEQLADQKGIETAEIREARAKRDIQTEGQKEVASHQAGLKATEGADEPDPAFGNSMQGLALSTMLRYKQAVEEGAVTPELEDEARAATHLLQQQKFFRDPQSGELLSQSTGVPQGFPLPPASSAGAAAQQGQSGNATQAVLGTGQTVGRAEVGGESKVKRSMDAATQTVSEVLDLLEAANRDGEVITGVRGQAKAIGGGLAREAGLPVSDRSRQLRAKLDILKFTMGPLVTGESGAKGLSDKERARLDEILGSVDYTMDETALRHSIDEILGLMEKMTDG